MKTISQQIYQSVTTALQKAGKTIWWLLKLIIPISLFVSLLQYWGIISTMAVYLKPAFSLIGLPGESAVVFISSIFSPLYAPIAIISTLALNIREITIIAIMCLISHNLFVETAIQKKTGSPAILIFFTRLLTSIVAAYIFNLLLPAYIGTPDEVQKTIVFPTYADMLINWLQNSVWLALKISLIISGLMILQSILKEFKVLDLISKLFAPFMRLMGLYEDSSFLWFVAQTLGLTYGSAVMLDEVENNEITSRSANLLNFHIAINHSLLEDTLLFVAIGVPAIWIIFPRFILAILIVWTVRFIFHYKQHKLTE